MIWLDMLCGDVRYACRTLLRSRTFTITAAVVLALGVGASTTVYGIVRGIALRPLPFEDPDRLMFVGELSPAGRREAVAPANFVDLAARSRTFERLAMYRGNRFILTGRPIPESVNGGNVSSSFFSALGIHAAHGRVFVPEDEGTNGPRAVVLSDKGWMRYFARNPAIVGHAITLDDVDHESRDVGARDEQQHRNGGQPGLYTGSGCSQDVLDDRSDSGFDVGLTMRPPRLIGNDLVQVPPCTVNRHAGLQSSDHEQHANVEDVDRTVGDAARDRRQIGHQRRPDVGAGGEPERRGHDPHDRE